jgi:hypothetical protein
MLHHIEWSMGTENAKELSACIFNVTSCTMKKKALHGFEMSLSICQLTLLKILENLHLYDPYSKSHKSC